MNGITFVIPDGYLGECAMCRNEAKHKVYTKFDPPIKTAPGLKDIEGCYSYVCDSCKVKHDAKQVKA